MSLTISCSLILQRAHIVGCLSVTPTTQRFFSNSAGCTTSRAPTTLVRNRLSSTSRNQWLLVSVVFLNIGHVHQADCFIQIKRTHRAGICLGAATCHSRSIPKHTRPTNRQSTVTAETRPFGAPLVCSITRSISIAMHLMHTPAQSD
jgi:hypothetical protein